MHIQAKATPAASPPDLEGFLSPISDPGSTVAGRQGINIEGISGDYLETGGELFFTFDHDREGDVRAWLEEKGYTNIEILRRDDDEYFQAELPANEPGHLLEAIRAATSQNLSEGRLIRNVLIGQETQPPHRFYVNITFQEVKRPEVDP